MNHERVPASYWLHAHGSSKASTAWRDVGWQTRQKNAHALSHSGRKGGVRRRETVGVGHAGGRARARHIYRAAAHGHAAHIAHKRSLRPRRACEQGGGGGTHSYAVREPRPMGLFWLAGWRTSGAIHASGTPPDTPVRRRCGAGRPPGPGSGEGGGVGPTASMPAGQPIRTRRGRGGRTVGVGHDGGRARARHIYRAAAHGRAAHFAHTRSLRPDAPVSCHRQGGRGGTELPRARAAADGGFSGSRGGVRGSGVPSMYLVRPQHPYATQPWMMGGHPPRLRGREAEEAARRRHLPIEVPYAGGGGRRHTGVWGAVTVTGH